MCTVLSVTRMSVTYWTAQAQERTQGAHPIREHAPIAYFTCHFRRVLISLHFYSAKNLYGKIALFEF